MLDDEGCLNDFLPMDLFLSTATHLALGMRIRVFMIVPWGLQSLVEISFSIEYWKYLNVSYSMDSSSVRLQVLVLTLVRMY